MLLLYFGFVLQLRMVYAHLFYYCTHADGANNRAFLET